MPSRAPRLCRRPGCPGTASSGVWCAKCAPAPVQAYRDENRARGTAAQRGYDADWRRVRAVILAREPLCRSCAARGLVTRATLVDHIVPLRAGGARLDPENLQPLCEQCHAVKTGAERTAR